MRKKMMKNELFYLHYPYRPLLDGSDSRALKYKVATSWDSKEYYHKRRLAQNLFDSERDMILESQDVLPMSLDDSKDLNSKYRDFFGLLTKSKKDLHYKVKKIIVGFQGMQLNRTVSDPDDVLEDNEGETGNVEEASQPDNQTLIRLLEENEKVVYRRIIKST